MRYLSQVSLLCVDTREPDAALRVMQHCLSHATFGEAILVTHPGYESPDPRIRVRHVARISSIEAYSSFMIKALGEYFACPHVLVVQWDGYIVHPEAWTDAFLSYDYIGAPWADRAHAVGNGGFSLRSRKLVDALAAPQIDKLHPEDYAICDLYHDLLVQQHGIQFAPVAVASQFSCEMIEPAGTTFGFHGIGTLHWVASGSLLQTLLSYIPPRAKLSQPARTLIKSLILAGRGREALPLIKARLATGTLKQRLDAAKLYLKAWF